MEGTILMRNRKMGGENLHQMRVRVRQHQCVHVYLPLVLAQFQVTLQVITHGLQAVYFVLRLPSNDISLLDSRFSLQ